MEKSSEVFKKIYSMAVELQRLAPWNYMYESEVFGIKIPGTDRIYFISVMGAEGQFFAISAYRGRQALAQFFQFQEEADTMPPETILTIPHLMLSFTNREELDKEQLASIRSSGLKFRGAGNWPRLEITEPGYLPVLPGGDPLNDAVLIFEQTLEVTRRAANGTDFLFREHEHYDALLIREHVRQNGKEKWHDIYEALDIEPVYKSFRMKVSEDDLKRMSRLPEKRIIIETDLVMLPTPIVPPGEKGYFPFILLMVDKRSGVILGNNILSPDPDLQSIYETVAEIVLKELIKLGYRPTRIEVRSDLMYSLLETPLKEARCRLLRCRSLPVLEEAVDSLRESL